MRAPSSFRDELAKYRQKLIADNPGHAQLRRAVKILNHWRNHPDAEKIWRTLQEQIPPQHMLSPEELIYLVLDQRFLAEKLQQIVDDLPKVERKTNERTRRHRKIRDYAAIGIENTLLGRARLLHRKVFGRQNTGRQHTAPELKFMRDWSARLQANCGKPLDEVVATLTGIAFDKVIDPKAVRAARRAKVSG